MKPHHVETIVAIADNGSLRAAASVLHKSQPAITKTLQNAEEDLGTQIFVRDPKGMIPTKTGTEIINRSRTIVNEYRRLEEEVKQIQGENTGSISMVISPLAAVKVVPLAIAEFRKKYPSVKIRIDGGQTPSALSPLRNGDADLVVAPAPTNHRDGNGLNITPIFSMPLIFITGGTSKYAAVTEVSSLASAQWLMFGPKEREPVIQGYLTKLGIELKHPLACSDSVLSILTLLENTDMVCTCPLGLYQEFSTRWNIVRIPVDTKLDQIDIAVITSAKRPPTSIVLAFKEMVIKAAEKI